MLSAFLRRAVRRGMLLVGILGFPAGLHAQASWTFAVSGDSRNCGDVVMPAIAAGVQKNEARFYWHLGDYRAMSHFDEDILANPAYRTGKPLTLAVYQQMAWDDFLTRQIEPFGKTPVFLGIGNHELVYPKTRAEYLQQFANWLGAPVIRGQQAKDDPDDHQLHTYYRWVEDGVGFVTLDNASPEQFGEAQVKWFEHVLALAASDSAVRTVVVGMHDALPDSLSAGHSMNESAQGERSGRRVYADLVAFREKTHKRVYVLASHSHFVLSDVYATACHALPGDVLPGWIVGTAGAIRYRLPLNHEPAKIAHTDVYGYLLGRVSADGEIEFEFKQITAADLPQAVKELYGPEPIRFCFEENKGSTTPAPPQCDQGGARR